MSAPDDDPDFGRPLPPARDRLAAELRPGETLLWSGRPDPGPAVIRMVPLAAFGLLFLAMGGAIFALHREGRAEPESLIFGAALGLGGGALMAAPVWALGRARGTAFAVTTARALIWEPTFPAGHRIRSYPPDRLQSLGRRRRRGPRGAGDLIFDRYQATNRFGILAQVRRGFVDLDDADTAEQSIRSTLLARRDAPDERHVARGPGRPDVGPGPLIRDDPRDDPEFAIGPADLDPWLKDELAPGEKVAWIGRPRPVRKILGLAPAALAPLPSVAIGAYLGLRGLGDGPNGQILAGLGGLLVLAGLGQSARALRSIGAAAGAAYLLTNDRAIVRTPGPGGRAEVESFDPATLGAMVRRERPDGSGDLIFREVAGSGPRRGRIDPRGFLAVDDVRAVEALVRSTLLDGRRGEGSTPDRPGSPPTDGPDARDPGS